jgi:hypothetical protein
MRISRLSALAVMATLALAPAANAMPQDQQPPLASGHHVVQQDLAHLRAGGTIAPAPTAAPRLFWSYQYQQDPAAAAKAVKEYNASLAKVHHSAPAADDSSPVAGVAIGLALIALVAGSVAYAVRSRRRSVRLAV